MESYEQRDNIDARITSIIVKNKPTLFDIKNHLLSLQKEYDSSAEAYDITKDYPDILNIQIE